ncbi:DUF401 family protein [Oceanidesulfovibrio marinus]|uniref:DUF401 family protein n=1 Tax=Oceanidesulfovibrio marinus TaxID=370038 RepID=A0ABX6NAR8_9BACT|nr:DUF401 family protein [Oceanidesulfovibrio marinus]QJT07681.1 DUF401 family protein [Oceanidesulfovibrio marinus]
MLTFASLIPLAKVIAAFAAMLVCIRLRINLAISIIIGSFILVLAFGHGPLFWLQAAGQGLMYEQTLFLAGIVGAIMLLSDVLEKTAQAERLMESLVGYLHRPRIALAFFPALIGLLPMPGGAVFSAPLVKRVADPMDLDAPLLSVINYWFRHVWELAWPLYPGVILASSLANVPLVEIALFLSPSPILALVLGWFFYLRRVPKTRRAAVKESITASLKELSLSSAPPAPSLRRALYEGLPILIGIGGALGLEGMIAVLFPGMPYEWGVIAALVAAVVCSLIQNGKSIGFMLPLLFSKRLGSMLLVIAAIFIFKETLTQTHAVEEIAKVASGSAALIFTTVFMPFFVGAVAGINVAFVGASFPLFLGMLDTLGMQDQTMRYVALGMFSGMSGVLVSPIHLCFILTCQYFGADLAKAWRLLVVPCMLVLGFGFLYFMMLG